MIRKVFELHVRCAECGTTLNLCYEKDARKTNQKTTEPTDTTGGIKVEQSLFVEPCKVCLEPLEKMRQAVKGLAVTK